MSSETARAAVPGMPALMAEMAHTLGVDRILPATAIAAAGCRCNDCADKGDCRDFLDVAGIRGADHAPSFCGNRELFDSLASEAPETF